MIDTEGSKRHEVANAIRAWIMDGTIPEGGKLPSEADLCRTFGYSRPTIQGAIETLTDEGLVVSRKGQGRYAATIRRHVWRANNLGGTVARSPDDAWAASVAKLGGAPSQQIRVEMAIADGPLSAWMRLPIGSQVVVRRRIRFIDGYPYSTVDSYFPRDVVRDSEIEIPHDIEPGTFDVLRRLGRPWERTFHMLTARQPTREESAVLRIPRGVPVLENRSTAVDRDDVPVQCTVFVLPGDRQSVEYVLGEESHHEG